MKRPTGSTMTKVGVEDLIRDSIEKPQSRERFVGYIYGLGEVKVSLAKAKNHVQFSIWLEVFRQAVFGGAVE